MPKQATEFRFKLHGVYVSFIPMPPFFFSDQEKESPESPSLLSVRTLEGRPICSLFVKKTFPDKDGTPFFLDPVLLHGKPTKFSGYFGVSFSEPVKITG